MPVRPMTLAMSTILLLTLAKGVSRISSFPMETTRPPEPRGVILASASPRRERLLRVLGVRFRVRPVHIAEEAIAGERAKQPFAAECVADRWLVAVQAVGV